MAPGHAMSGVCTGLIVAPWAVHLAPGELTPARALVLSAAFSALVSFFALWPDIDHKPAVISKIGGPVSWLLCWIFRMISEWFYEVTRTEKDRAGGCHRTFTHTNFGTLLTAAALLAGLKATPYAGWAWWWAAAFAVGCLTHIWVIGDACTLSGVPHPLAPFVVVDGKRWATVGFPSWMRFRAGGKRKSEETSLFGVKIKVRRKPMFTGERVATVSFSAVAGILGGLTLIANGAAWWSPVLTLIGG